MTIYKGSQNLVEIYKGNIKISEIYKGSQLIYTSSNWKKHTIPDSKVNDCSIFNSDTHGLLIISNGNIYKTDLNTISLLANLSTSTSIYITEVYYNNLNNKLVFIIKDADANTKTSYISTDTSLSVYNKGPLPGDQYSPYASTGGQLIYGNGYYVIGGEYQPSNSVMESYPAVFYSTDGINWNRSILNESFVSRQGGTVDQIGFGNNRFIALGNYFVNGEFDTSAISVSNPNNWSNKKACEYTGHPRNKIIFCNGYFYHYTWGEYLIRSSDGITWEKLTKPSGYDPDHYNFNIYYKNNLYYITDENYIYSTSDFIIYKKYEGANVKSGIFYRIGYALYDNYFVVSDGLNIYYSLISELKEA